MLELSCLPEPFEFFMSSESLQIDTRKEHYTPLQKLFLLYFSGLLAMHSERWWLQASLSHWSHYAKEALCVLSYKHILSKTVGITGSFIMFTKKKKKSWIYRLGGCWSLNLKIGGIFLKPYFPEHPCSLASKVQKEKYLGILGPLITSTNTKGNLQGLLK